MHGKKTVTRLIQDAIDKGSTTVEEVHKSIAELPMKMLEKSDFLRGPAKEVRRVQDHAIGAIYDLIRDINQEVGTLASDLLAEARARGAVRGGAGAKKRATARHAAR
jgi:hypothetical protein